jgi:hypothetical protein
MNRDKVPGDEGEWEGERIAKLFDSYERKGCHGVVETPENDGRML